MSRNSPLPPQNYHQMHSQQQQPCPQGYENGWRGPPQLQIQPPLTVSSSSPSPSPQFYSPGQPSPYQQQQIYRPILQQQQQQQPQQQQSMYSPMYSQPRPQQQAQPQRPSINQFGPAAAQQKISSLPSPSPNHSPMNIQLQQQQQMYNPINRRPDNQSMLFGKPRSGKIQPEAAIAPMPISPSIEELTIYEMPGCQQLPPPKQQQQPQQQAFRPQQPPPQQQQQFSRPQSQQSNPIQLAPPKQQTQFTNRISPPPMLLSIQQPQQQQQQQQQQQHHYQYQYNKNTSPTPPITPQPQAMYPGANGGIQAPLYGHRQGVSPQPPAMMLSNSSTTSLSSSSSSQQLLNPSQFEFHPPAANSTPLTTTTNPPAAFNNNRSPNNMENMSGNKNYNNKACNQHQAPDFHNYRSNNNTTNTTNKSALDKFMEQNEFSVYSTEMAKKYLSDSLNSITLLKANFDETSSIEPSYLREDSSYGDKTLMPTTFDKKLFRKFEESSMYFGNSNVPENDSISDIKFTPALPPPPLHNNKPFNPHFYADNCMNKYNDSVPVSIEDMRLDNTTRLDFYAGGGMSSLNISTSTAKNSNFGAEHDHKYEEYRHRYMKDDDDGSDDEKWPFPNKETETDFNNRFNNNNGRRFSPRADSNDSRGVSPPSDAECNAVSSSRNIPNQIIDIDAVMNLPKLL